MAANFSGKAINIAKTNAPHALSYLFTSKYKIPHGIAVSIFFIEIINFYFFSALREKNKKLITRFRLLFKIFSINNLNQFNIFFNKIFIKSGIKKYLNESLKNLRYKKKFYFDLERLNNSPFNISKDYINNLYSNKLKF
jgi:alcohol dehydrogenase class IV